MKKDTKKRNNDSLEQKKVENFRNSINNWIKVVGILVLVIIIIGMTNNNGANRDRDSAIEYEARANKKLNDNIDGRIYEENKTNQKVSETSYISRDDSKRIAFNNAGVSASKVRDLEVELDHENGRRVYEVGFEAGNVDYSYEIDAQSGKILRKEKDVERRDNDRYDD